MAEDAAKGFAFQGQWETRFPSGNYVGIVLIDSERRATWDSPKDQGRPAKYLGYVAEAKNDRMVLHFTDRAGVGKTFCEIRSSEMLHCHNIRPDGSRSDNFLMVKVGPGPHRLTPAP
jgi:hypothetical protein